MTADVLLTLPYGFRDLEPRVREILEIFAPLGARYLHCNDDELGYREVEEAPEEAGPCLDEEGDLVLPPGSRQEQLDWVAGLLTGCQRCPLGEDRITRSCRLSGVGKLVFGGGCHEAEIMLVGQAPGRQEDVSGEAFVGPAGQMLDRMLAAVLGLRRDQVYVCNVLKCYPPCDREPTVEESEACRPFLRAQLRIVRPRVVIALGTVAARLLFDSKSGIHELRGRWFSCHGVLARATFHPSYLCRISGHDGVVTELERVEKIRVRSDLTIVQAVLRDKKLFAAAVAAATTDR
jgi:DNA polymerase